VEPKKAMWMALATGADALGTVAVRQGPNQAWRLATEEAPPQ
jgi:hypothetical protein